MSQNSPAKHERVERHLMRQRGTGARTVQADFGFSFAAFNAPTSHEASPSTVPIEPRAKRRKTAVEQDFGREEDPVKWDILDRRGRTKAARTKKRFVVDAEDEPVKGKAVEAADGHDSFVAGAGIRKRKASRKVEADEVVEAAQLIAVENNATAKPVGKAQSVPRKPQQKRKRVAAKEDADLRPEVPELVAEENVTPTTKQRVARKSKNTVDQDIDAALEPHAEEREAATAAELEPKPKKRAPRKIAKQILPRVEKSTLEQQTLGSEAVTGKQRKRAPRRPGKETVLEHENSPSEQRPDPREIEATAPKVTEKARSRSKTETKIRNVGLPDPVVEEEDESKVSAGDVPAAQPTEPFATAVSKVTRQKKVQKCQDQKPLASVLYEEDEAAKAEPVPIKKSRAPARSIAVKKAVLDSTPPQLERRPLQEADANRSPRPRRSPEKISDKMGNLKVEGNKRGKRKREDATDEITAAARSPRKSRKLRVRRDEPQDIEAKVGHTEPTVQTSSVPDGATDQTTVATAEEHKAKKVAKKKQAKTPASAQQPATPTTAYRRPTASKDQVEDEEDIDWLFAAPQTKPQPAPAPPKPLPVTKTSAAPRKSKLVDIDLDDLIADVAAFAQSGAVVASTQANSSSTACGPGVRKGRKK